MTNIKKCSKCGIEKDLSLFGKYKKSKSGYKSWCKECHNKNNKKYREKNKEKNKEYFKEWREENSDYLKEYNKEYQREYQKQKCQEDPKFRFKKNLRTAIWYSFKLYSKNGKTKSCKEYGIDFKAIFKEIGHRPDPSYHLDHIIPLSLFDLDNPEQVRLAHVPQNLRWLPGRENLEKNNKIDFQAIICSLQLRTICLFIGVDIFDKSQWL